MHPQSRVTPSSLCLPPSLLCHPSGSTHALVALGLPSVTGSIPIAPRRWAGAAPATLGKAPEALSPSRRGRAGGGTSERATEPGAAPWKDPPGCPAGPSALAIAQGSQSSREGQQPGTPNPGAAMRTLATLPLTHHFHTFFCLIHFSSALQEDGGTRQGGVSAWQPPAVLTPMPGTDPAI